MAGRSRSHSEQWWANNAPPFAVRCQGSYKSTGGQCRHDAVDGAVVCDQHGGASPQVLRRAAERIQMTADDAAQRLVEWMNDPAVEMRERVKIAQDMLDRGGLGAAQLLKIMPVAEDPIERLFQSILSEPEGTYDAAALEARRALETTRQAELAELIGTFPGDEDDEIIDAEIVEDDGVVVPMRRDAPKPRNPTAPPKHIREGLGLRR